jgi:chemotaxis family two-component system sensor kinase Cph1
MFTTDLTNCDKEPIHIPGKIQGHGFLIGVDQSFTIAYCSDNISSFLNAEPGSLLGKPLGILDSYLEKTDPADFLIHLIKLSHTTNGFEPENPYLLQIKDKFFNVILSKSANYFLIEFEPEISSLNSDIQRIMGSSLSGMLADTSLSRLLSNAAEQIKKIIGYDRVMIYKFHDDGHGEVVSEVREPELEPFLGLHYPASDIPKQARELYKHNFIRLIADVETESAELLSDDSAERSLDLTNSSLRAVSPIHIQYLKNMGVASSFSISLLHLGELWGLVACHNYSPRFINFKEREAAKLIGLVLSSALSFRVQEEMKQKSGRFTAAVETLSKQLLRDDNIANALLNHDTTLIDAVEASGAVLIFDNQIFTVGITPPERFIVELTAWLSDHMNDQLFETSNLSAQYPPALAYKAEASGLLACRLSRDSAEYMFWFRPEVLSTVSWAGNPNKPLELNVHGTLDISPRTSFNAWLQTVEHTSARWKNEEFESVIQLKEEISFAIMRRAAEVQVLNEKLKVAYDELDAFSYTISHDLKNSLSSIKSYAQILPRKFDLDPGAKHMVSRILNAAEKMQNMITEVLNYSQVGQTPTNRKTVDMDSLLTELKMELMVSGQQGNLQINIEGVEDIYGDETMIMQVFSNLLGNAVKYSGKSDQPVVRISAKDLGQYIQYAVQDNGIGIKLEDQPKIFDLFARSADVAEIEGSGIGLSIAKKIMNKHDGKIWVESDGKSGSTFYLEFVKVGEPAFRATL